MPFGPGCSRPFSIAPPVGEVHDHSEHEPDDESLPCRGRQGNHLQQAERCTEQWHPWNERSFERPGNLRRGAAKDQDSKAYENKSEERSHADENAQHSNREDARSDRDE